MLCALLLLERYFYTGSPVKKLSSLAKASYSRAFLLWRTGGMYAFEKK